MPETPGATNDLWEAMYTQRAVRYFRPDPVPQELLTKLIEAATRAPSGSNLQPWGFVIVTDDAMRARIAARIRERFMTSDQLKAYIEAGRNSGDPSRRIMMDGVSNIVSNLNSAPVFIFPCLQSATSSPPEGLLTGSSIYPAVQNLLLAARGLGLGAVMTTFQAPMVKDLAEWLHLPANTTPVALIPLGYPAVRFGPVKRKPVDEVTHWETWGGKGD
jgi:nitroreductase